MFKPGQFYVLAAFLGCVLFALLAVQLKMEATSAAGIAIGTTFVFRLLAIQFNWKSSPVWKEPPAPLPPTEPKPDPSGAMTRAIKPDCNFLVFDCTERPI